MVAETYPQDTARMVAAVNDLPAGDNGPSLQEIAAQSGATRFLEDILGGRNPGGGGGER